MTQEFKGPVGDVAGRDLVKNQIASRLLIKHERRTLNNLINKLELEYGEPANKTWKSIHNILGVENIEEIRLEHYKPTEKILGLLLENAQILSGAGEVVLRARLKTATAEISSLTKRNADLMTKATGIQQDFISLDALHKKQTVDLKLAQEQLTYAQMFINKAKAAITVLHRRFLLMYVLPGLIGVGVIFLVSRLYAGRDVCEFGGNPYTVGSVIDNPQAHDVVCVGADGATPQWQKLNRQS